MRTTTTLLTLGFLVSGALPIQAETVEEVIAKHIEAHGGREAWQAVDSLELSGDFTGFSQIHPFTLTRQKERRYHLDHQLGDKPVVIGFDGETLWWDNQWLQDGAAKVSEGADLAVLERELDFVTALFDVESRGHSATLLETTELEGQPVIALEIQRADESSETWFLDPETYLEIARDSPASDFGRLMTQRTYFDDFREVEGVILPFFTETQWYTRHRVMEVHTAKINPTVDPALFSMPTPPGMKDLLELAGTWQVAAESRSSPQEPWSTSEHQSTIVERLGQAMIEETFSTRDLEISRSFSYDRARKHWVMTSIDDQSGLMDIQVGKRSDAGTLSLSNLETGTTREVFGFTVHERSELFPLEDGGFRMERHNSIDGGETWFESQKLSYSRSLPSDG